MQAIDDMILVPVESAFAMVGLNTPLTRGIAVGVGVGVVSSLLKPALFYDAKTKAMRPWTFYPGDSTVAPTVLPLWLASAGAGVLTAMFI